MVAHLTANQQSWVQIQLLPSTQQTLSVRSGQPPEMTQYRVLASEGRQRYIYTKTHKNIQEKNCKLETVCLVLRLKKHGTDNRICSPGNRNFSLEMAVSNILKPGCYICQLTILSIQLTDYMYGRTKDTYCRVLLQALSANKLTVGAHQLRVN